MNKLDLNKIEEKLDTSLENETTESLTNWLKEKRDKNNNMAQQKLEEAAKELYPTKNTGSMFMPNRDELNNSYKQEAFIESANWMQKQMYSEEDMRKAFKIGHQCARQGSYNDITEQEDFDKWKELGYPINFEQYKIK